MGLSAILGMNDRQTQGKDKERKRIARHSKRYADSTPAADAASRKRRASEWRLKIEAGQAHVAGPSTAAAMAARLAGPGTIATARGTRIRNGMVRESARRGTASSVANDPSWTC